MDVEPQSGQLVVLEDGALTLLDPDLRNRSTIGSDVDLRDVAAIPGGALGLGPGCASSSGENCGVARYQVAPGSLSGPGERYPLVGDLRSIAASAENVFVAAPDQGLYVLFPDIGEFNSFGDLCASSEGPSLVAAAGDRIAFWCAGDGIVRTGVIEQGEASLVSLFDLNVGGTIADLEVDDDGTVYVIADGAAVGYGSDGTRYTDDGPADVRALHPVPAGGVVAVRDDGSAAILRP